MDELNENIKSIEDRLRALETEEKYLLYTLELLCELRKDILSGKVELQSKY